MAAVSGRGWGRAIDCRPRRVIGARDSALSGRLSMATDERLRWSAEDPRTTSSGPKIRVRTVESEPIRRSALPKKIEANDGRLYLTGLGCTSRSALSVLPSIGFGRHYWVHC